MHCIHKMASDLRVVFFHGVVYKLLEPKKSANKDLSSYPAEVRSESFLSFPLPKVS